MVQMMNGDDGYFCGNGRYCYNGTIVAMEVEM